MKKIILLMMLALTMNSALAYEYNSAMIDNAVKEDQQIEFCPIKNMWGRNFAINNLLFTKHITHGSGSFSEYELKKKLYDTDTTYEFLYNNQLIGYNMHKLKFYNMEFENDKFKNTVLSDIQLKELFPNVEIVKVSQFKDNKITLDKPWFESKTFLLVNDTDRDFYKYQFENYKKQDELIRGLFEVKRPGTLIYSHFGSRDEMFPILKIHVRNTFEKAD